jgi:hypothetical protein
MFNPFVAARPVRVFLGVAFLAGAALLGGCATQYVDGAVKDVPVDQFQRPAQLHPAQVVFEFQTKGAANARATEQVKPMVMESVKSTGLFSDVQDKPVPGAALLSIKINNIVLTDDVYAKGFMAGLTLGLAGSTVTDGYICTVSYLAPGRTTPIVETSKHAIHTSVGNGGAPANGIKAANIQEAVRIMVRQITAHALKDLSHDPEFK